MNLPPSAIAYLEVLGISLLNQGFLTGGLRPHTPGGLQLPANSNMVLSKPLEMHEWPSGMAVL